jgi:hypothetical protein
MSASALRTESRFPARRAHARSGENRHTGTDGGLRKIHRSVLPACKCRNASGSPLERGHEIRRVTVGASAFAVGR